MTDNFSNLRTASNKVIEDRRNSMLKTLDDPETFERELHRHNKNYKTKPKERLIQLLTKRYQKEIDENNKEIDAIQNAKDFFGDFVITVEWTPSKTWGSNPRAYTNYGYESGSIGGCGYDKLSTATASALNSNLSILKLMYAMKNQSVNISNHELFGYGSGYGVLPNFEGGVGVSSHQKIVETIGLQMQHITSTKNTDVFIISKKEVN